MDDSERLLQELFRTLKLHDAYLEQTKDPAYSAMPFGERIAHILKRQVEGRSMRKFASLYKKSGIEDLMPGLSRVDYAAERGFSKSQMAELCQCRWMTCEKPRWLVITGATGTGKAFLAKTILLEALKKEIPGVFKPTSMLVEDFEEAHTQGRIRELRKDHSKIRAMVLDDFLLKGVKEERVNDIKHLLDSFYQKRSLILTSQYPLEEWYERMGDTGDQKDAIMDRIVANSRILELTGNSMRLKDGLAAPDKEKN